MLRMRKNVAGRSRARDWVVRTVVLGGFAVAAGVSTFAAPAHAQAQSFRFCIVDEDAFRIKDVKLYLRTAPGTFMPLEPLPVERFKDCNGSGRFWRFEVVNSLETPGNRAILEFKFKTEKDAGDSDAESSDAGTSDAGISEPEINSTVTLSMRLFALNKIGEPDNRVDIWIPASVPEKLVPSYLDELERLSKPHQIQKLMHAAILYDHLEALFGPKSDVTRRAAVVLMNAAAELSADTPDSESLYDIPDFVIKTIEESLGKRSYWERIVRRFEESRSAPIVKADALIRELIHNGQCASARNVLHAISAYVGEDTYLLEEVRVPPTHLDDLGAKIDRECNAEG